MACSNDATAAGIAEPLLHPRERGAVERCLAEEAHRRGLVGGPRQRTGRIVEAVLGLRDPAEHRLGVHDPPRVAVGARMPTASVASRVAVAVSPTISDPNAESSRLPAICHSSSARAVRRQAGRAAREHHVGPSLLDGQEGLVTVHVRDEHLVVQRRRDLAGSVEVRLGEYDVAGRRLEPSGKEKPVAKSRAGDVVGRALRTRAAPAVPSPRTTQVQPNPFAMRTPRSGSCAAHHANATSTLARSARAIARHSGCRSVRTCSSHQSASLGVPLGVRGVGHVGLTGLTQPLGGVRLDAVEQPVAHRTALGALDADQRAVDQPADRVEHGARRDVQRRQHVLGRIQRGARRRSTTTPTGPAGRRGTTARSSTRSRRPAHAVVPGAGWSGRAAARTGHRADGRCRAPTATAPATPRARSPEAARPASGTPPRRPRSASSSSTSCRRISRARRVNSVTSRRA